MDSGFAHGKKPVIQFAQLLAKSYPRLAILVFPRKLLKQTTTLFCRLHSFRSDVFRIVNSSLVGLYSTIFPSSMNMV